VVLLKDVLTEDETEFIVWKDRAISSVGFLNFSNCGGAIGKDMKDLTACFPFEVLVNFGEFSKLLELSEGLFLGICKEPWLLAWESVCPGLADGDGDGDGDGDCGVSYL
jgi:hypothetical protein